MKGSPEVISALQVALQMEAQINLQCRMDWRSLKFMGVKKVAKKVHDIGSNAHDYMKKVTDRILFLEGNPEYQIAKVSEQVTVTELLANELVLEMAVIEPYEKAVQTAMAAFDDTTRNLFEHLLKWHEQDIAWISQQLALIKGLGEAEYVAEKL